MNAKIFEIIRREYLERVTKKSFWISTILLPVIMLGSLFLPALFATMSLQDKIRIAVIDLGGRTFEQLRENLLQGRSKVKQEAGERALKPKPADEAVFELEQVPAGNDFEATLKGVKIKIGEKKYEGCLVIGKDFDQSDCFQYYGRNVSNLTVLRALNAGLDPIVIADRLTRNQISVPSEKLREWIRGADLVTFQVQEGGTSKKSGVSSAIFITFGFVMILYVSLIVYGVANLRGVLEEKTSRIMEVLLANFTSGQLMTGKLVGIGLVGLTQMIIYAATGGMLMLYGTVTAMAFNPGLAEAVASINPMALVYFVVFFVLGYFIFSALFLGVGALCSTEEDAQNMQSPVIMLLVVPMVCTMFFITNPDSLVAVIVSMIPVFTPMVMMMRILVLTPPLWQILLSIALCVAFIFFLLWAVAKVFRIGVLMYGKRPTLKEIYHWFRAA